MAKALTESLTEEQLTDEGHKLTITVRRYPGKDFYIHQVFDPEGNEMYNLRSWEIYPMMQSLAHIYKFFDKQFALQILTEICEEMKEAGRN
ncbi:hypothetical protein [Paenibacillus xylanexedens]|uniref:hypothetical protein n=1 Tax=Paenibacillus xylanexedens TaxID=528191 RepID=UPI00119D6368|nr:hypothetical protein [Paenibacillus xylanexedens]